MAFFVAAQLWSCGSDRSADDPLLVAAAANVQYAMQELETAFEAETGEAIDVVVSSSGKLTAQIMQGAPYDLLLSANMLYPNTLLEAGMASDTPRVYALGTLVLWTLREIELDTAFQVLTDPRLSKIAMANPRNAPYGEEARRALQAAGIYEQVESKLVYGESIAQTNQYILTMAADVGLTAKSIVSSPAFRQRGTWVEVPSTTYRPIRQGAVITRYGMEHHPAASRRFLEFLSSAPAQDILRRYGYRLPDR